MVLRGKIKLGTFEKHLLFKYQSRKKMHHELIKNVNKGLFLTHIFQI